jgi:excisionase family DNA binding protein
MDKALYTIDESMTYSGVGKTAIYDALARGMLRARKFGRRTLIEAESLRAFVAALPAANFKPKRKAHEDREASAV